MQTTFIRADGARTLAGFCRRLLQLANWIVLCAMLCTVTACDDMYRYAVSGEVGRALKKELDDERASEVALVKLTSFPWDEFFVFSALAEPWEICQRLQLDPAECKSTVPSGLSDTEVLLIFRNAGQIVHQETHFRVHGNFRRVYESSFTPKTAVFAVIGDTSVGAGRRLEPIAVASTTLRPSGGVFASPFSPVPQDGPSSSRR